MRIYYFFLIAIISAQALPFRLYGQQNRFDTTENPDLIALKKQTENAPNNSLIPLWEAALAKYKMKGDTCAWARCLWGLGAVYNKAEQYEKSAPFLAEAVALSAQQSRERCPETAFDAFLEYGFCLRQKKDLDRCLAILRQALEQGQNLFQRPDVRMAHANRHMSLAYYMKKNYNAAEQYAEQAIEIYRQVGGQEDLIMKMYANIGLYCRFKGEFDRALEYYGKMEGWLDSIAELPGDMRVKFTYLDMAVLHDIYKNYEKAKDYTQKIYNICEKQGWPSDWNAVRVRFEFGAIETEQGIEQAAAGNKEDATRHFQQALSYLEEAEKVAYSNALHQNPLMATLYERMYCCLAYLGRTDEAKAAREKTLASAQGDPQSLYYAHALWGRLHAYIGQYEESVSNYRQVAAMNRIRPQSNFFVSLTNMANMHCALGAYDEALTCIDEALRLQLKPGATGQSFLSIPDSLLPFSATAAASIGVKALVLYHLGEQKNDRSLLTSSLEWARQSIRLYERLRRELYKNGAENYESLRKKRLVYAAGVKAAARLHRQTQDPAMLETAFRLADLSRSMLLSESVHSVAAKKYAGVPETLLKQEENLNKSIARLEKRIFEETAANPETLENKRALLALKAEREQLIHHLERSFPRYYELRYQTDHVKASDIQAALAPDALFVEYMLHPNENKAHVFVIEKNRGLQAQEIELTPETEKDIKTLRNLLQSAALVRRENRERFIETSNRLYRQLIAPIADQINGKKEIAIVADAYLHYLPFEILLKEPTQTTFEQLDFLMRRVSVSYQYSAALFLNQRRPALQLSQSGPNTLAAFAPVFGEDPMTGTAIAYNRATADTALRAFGQDGYFTPLPYSELETRHIVEQIGANRSRLLTRQDADEAALKGILQAPFRIIHIASHSFANLAQPKFSGIACAPSRAATDEDGILYANEIYNLDIAADLLVLSSCESGLGKLSGGEGLLGLNRAFAYAGAPNIMYTLWKVNDKAGSELMIEFYKQMLAGKSYSAALRAAKLKMLENPVTASPNLWAGFLLMGR